MSDIPERAASLVMVGFAVGVVVAYAVGLVVLG